MSERHKSDKPHPWGHFLNARWAVILWMREEMGYSDKQISQQLSMDEMQVYLIRNSKYMPIPEGKHEW